MMGRHNGIFGGETQKPTDTTNGDEFTFRPPSKKKHDGGGKDWAKKLPMEPAKLPDPDPQDRR